MTPALSIRSTEGLAERRNVLHAAGAVTLLFGITDHAILGRFAFAPSLLRIFWAGAPMGAGFALPRMSDRYFKAVAVVLGFLSGACFAGLVYLTGGTHSAMFHGMLAVPLTVAVVVQDYPRATLTAGAATFLGGAGILLRVGTGPVELAGWLIQAAGMSALAVYASAVYHRLRVRERELERTQREAEQRGMLFESERKARQRAESLLDARDTFLSVASHELRTPLAVLQLRVDQLERGAPVGMLLHRLQQQINRLARLANDLLETSVLVSGRKGLILERLDLGVLVEGIVLALELERDGRMLDLTLQGDLRGRRDQSGLERVVLNLLDNASEYGGGLPVEIKVQADGGEVVLVFIDHGAGISPEDQVRIFQRFERAVSHRKSRGFGIGLWVVSQVVEWHGGQVALTSAPGGGSTFEVRLPRGPALRPAP